MYMQVEKSNNNNNANNTNNNNRDDIELSGRLVSDLDLISRFCTPICCRDAESRERALDAIGMTVQGWLDGAGSPARGRRQSRPQINVSDVNSEHTRLVTLHLPILLRLSLNCPFVNVRERCQNILDVVKVSFSIPIFLNFLFIIYVVV